MLRVFVILCFVTVLVKSEHVRRRREGGRQGKLFTFHTLDEDIRKNSNALSIFQIDLDFTVPFLSIPVKKTMNSAYGFLDFPTININPASLALGGAVVLGTSIVVPFILKYYAHENSNRYSRSQLTLVSTGKGSPPCRPGTKPPSARTSRKRIDLATTRQYRLTSGLRRITALSCLELLRTDYLLSEVLDNTEFGADAVLDFAQQMLSGSHGFRGCPLRVACWAAQQEYASPSVILNQIVNNRLLSSMVNSSAVEDAMISGRHGRSCSSYGPCPLQEHHVPILMTNLAVLANSPGFK